MAGLGNQMFQYATARALAHRRHTRLLLDTSTYEAMAAIDTPRKYELDVYNIKGTIASSKELQKIQQPSSVKKMILKDIKHNVIKRDSKLWPYHERTTGYDSRVKWLPNNSYLVGWWQCPKYFESIRPALLKEFEPVKKPNKRNAELLKLVSSCSSVAIHVRRGDYVSNKHASSHHGLAPIDYYSQAIRYIEKQVPSARFIVFSDDLKWCRKELPLPKDSIFVEGNDGNKAYEDIRIMKNCKHAIIANSSFSWWGAWLNTNPSKIIIAPKEWFQNKQANDEIQIIPKDWKRL